MSNELYIAALEAFLELKAQRASEKFKSVAGRKWAPEIHRAVYERIVRARIATHDSSTAASLSGTYNVDRFRDLIVKHNLKSDFGIVWEFSRLLHNIGLNQEALTYAKLAKELAPGNQRVHAKITEIYTDLGREIPQSNYRKMAEASALRVWSIEPSAFAAKLWQNVTLQVA